jgi:tetratricopeptide (TPR) repeat protein
MWNRKIAAAAVLAAGCGAAAIACGPFFPWELLDNRGQTLKATPVNSFGFEAGHLAPSPADKLKPVESFDFAWASQMRDQQMENAARELGEAESGGLSTNGIILLRAARAAGSGPEALEKGKGLPLAVLHYTAGAVAWHKSDTAFAKTQFETLLRLPDKERKPRAVWAAYMLGRIGAENHDEAAAASGFHWARDLAKKGAPDPLGLAVASYGEEARVHLQAAEALLEAGGGAVSGRQGSIDSEAGKYSGSVLPNRQIEPFRKEIAKAVALYAEQAARGSNSGIQSLRIVAEFLLDRSDRIAAGAREPQVQRLMVAYALRLAGNNTYDHSYSTGYTAPNAIQVDNQLSAERQRDVFADLIAALKMQSRPAGADRIAALCYSRGDWACATDFAKKSDSPLAAWVEAKLSTQRGDLAAAAKFYAEAVHGFPTSNALEEDGKKLVLGESGVVALARGDYVDALAKLWPVSGTYWSDVAYLAERVLTVDELKAFVDAHVPPGKVPVVDGKPAPYGTPFDSRVTLRDLLARRLMREKRYDEAFGYFSTDKVREAAKAYAAALKQADRRWGKVDKAEALFQAATIARQSGMEIMGTEGPPDEYFTEGEFPAGLGRDTLTGPFITKGERDRFAASKATPDQRFHYRYLAIDEAGAAADLVPDKSQAFAAMLCHATAWSGRDPARAKALWLRYVKQGARVPFAKTFGVKCPAPDFKGAIQMERKIMIRDAKRYVSRNRWWFAGGGSAGLLAIAGIVAFLLLRRRRPA